MVKRFFDVVSSGAMLVAASPLLFVAAVAVRLDSRGPVLYRGRRVGLHGRPFRILKLRTMAWESAAAGPSITRGQDPRVTRVGRVLRRTKLDEVPQLVNVLLGEMSLVGPRPEDPEWVATYSAEQRRLLSVRPGITSPASLAYAQEERLLAGDDWRSRYGEEILPTKVAMELAYLERRSFWSDLWVLAQTVWRLRPRRSAG